MTLIFSIHYFLWYGAITSIFGYLGVYARHYTNATTIQFGYLNMLLPFTTVIATPLFCSLADRRRSHRSYLTFSLTLTTVSLCLFAFLPLILNSQPLTKEAPRDDNRETASLRLGAWVFYCLISLMLSVSIGIVTCLSDSFAILLAEERGTSFGRIIVWGTFGWAMSALTLSWINQSPSLPRFVPGILFGSCLLALDVLFMSFWKRDSDFQLDFIPVEAAQSVTGSSSPTHKEPSDYLPSNDAARINLGSEFDDDDGSRRRKTANPVAILNREADSTSVDMSKSDINLSSSVKTIQSDLDRVHNLDSTIGSDMMVTSSKRKTKSKRSTKKSRGIEPPAPTSIRMQLILLGLILKRRKSLIRFLLLFVASGFFMSMHWNYFFLYLEQIYYEKFEIISALSMVNQSILGELPFFIVSRKLINFFGRSHTLSISIISIGIRFFLYRYLLPNFNMIFIVFADCLQGPNYGLFYVVMTEVGLEYSFCDNHTIETLAARGELDKYNKLQVDSVRLSLRSTIQSVAFACYEGIGLGLGSVVGGWIVNSFGYQYLWLSMAIGATSIGCLNIVVELLCREHDPEEERSESQEFRDANRRGTLTKLVSLQPLPPAPTAQTLTAKLPQKLDARIQMLVRKSAGWRPAAV